jgi:hypothetical protein
MRRKLIYFFIREARRNDNKFKSINVKFSFAYIINERNVSQSISTHSYTSTHPILCKVIGRNKNCQMVKISFQLQMSNLR